MNCAILAALVVTSSVERLPDREVAVREANYDVSKMAPYRLEDPLLHNDGSPVVTAGWPMRRKEILRLFAAEMYGAEPPLPESFVTELVDEKTSEAGFAIRRQYRMWFKADKTGPCVGWIVWLPRAAKKPVPVISFLNYGGNHELTIDKDVPVMTAWIRGEGHAAGEASRGRCRNPDSRVCAPVGMILARGYALMSACYAEVSPDPDPKAWGCDHDKYPQHEFAYTGVFELWGKRDSSRTDNITSLGAWGWALSRGLDLAERISEIDAKRAVVTGYSRLGKAALIAAARDERFAVCVPIQTGGGGCPLAKRDYGENVSLLNRRFTHWFCTAYAKYAADPAALLKFDQHLLLACIAPRGLLVEGFDDPWYDTEGEYLAVKAADCVWKLLGYKGMPDVVWPADYERSAIGDRLGYVHRDGVHGIADCDWMWLLDFSDGIVGR